MDSAPMHTPLQAQQAQAAQNGPTLAPPGSMPGSKPSDTADNIPAKISPDEFVVPAYAVRFFGLNHFHKLVKQAQEGLQEMNTNGLIKQQPPQPSSSSPNTAPPPAPIKSAGGGFFAAGGVYDETPVTTGGYQMPTEQGYAGGGLVKMPTLAPVHAANVSVPAVPAMHRSPIGFKIPHNTGIVHSGVQGPVHRDIQGAAPTTPLPGRGMVKLAAGGFMGTDMGNPGANMYAAPAGNPNTPSTQVLGSYKPSPQGLGTYPYS